MGEATLSSPHTKLAIVGFPKCGTSALTRALSADPDVEMLVRPDGQIEVTWPLIEQLESEMEVGSDTEIVVHKWTAYVYSTTALEYLAGDRSRKFVLCVRDPLKVLVSWHNMHRRIAEEGRLANHFAFKERDFYLTCSLDEYYEAFAASRLEYDRYFERLVSIVGADRVLVVSQERMASDMDDAVAACRALAGVREDAHLPLHTTHHVGFADQARADVSPSVVEELERVRDRLMEAIGRTGVAALA